jgi:hypothetical protein
VYEKERASRIEGSRTSTIATRPSIRLSADSLASHLSCRFYVWIPPPGQGQIIHIPLRPLVFNCLRPYRSFCHPLLYLLSTINLAGSSSACQQSRRWRTTTAPCPVRHANYTGYCKAFVPSYIVVFRIFCSFLYS